MDLSYLDSKIAAVRKQLRPYQIEDVEKLTKHKRWLNYLDMGMGKSLITLLSVMELRAFPCIIFCNKAAMGVMQNELKIWFDMPSVIYSGKKPQRDKQWKQFVEEGHKFIIANYAMAEELGKRFGKIHSVERKKGSSQNGNYRVNITPPGTQAQWQIGAIVCDEIHTAGLFNHQSKTYMIIKALAATAKACYLLTGTPYRKGIVDFYGPLSIVRPDKFDSYWKYVNTFGIVVNTGFGKSIERNPRDAVQFRTMLRMYASIRKKTDYLHDMPTKTRQPIPVTMDDEQRRVYKDLTKELMAITDGGELIMTPSILTLSIRQRQLLVCPQEIGLKTRGAAIDTMIEMSEELVEQRKPFVIFTPFRKAVPWIRQALREEYPNVKVFEITGGLTAAEFTERWKGFQDARGCNVLICVIKSGASFHATVADTAFFLGYEYDFNQNAQAEDRLYRIGQKKAVTCYYLLHKGTIEDDIIDILNDKKFSADLVLSEEAMFRKMISKKEGY